MAGKRVKTISPGHVPARGLNAAHIYHSWFARVGDVPEPHLELPHCRSSWGQLVRALLGAHLLLVDMGRRHSQAEVADIYDGGHHVASHPLTVPTVGDERHLAFGCPALEHIQTALLSIYARSHLCTFQVHRACAHSCGTETRKTRSAYGSCLPDAASF